MVLEEHRDPTTTTPKPNTTPILRSAGPSPGQVPVDRGGRAREGAPRRGGAPGGTGARVTGAETVLPPTGRGFPLERTCGGSGSGE